MALYKFCTCIIVFFIIFKILSLLDSVGNLYERHIKISHYTLQDCFCEISRPYVQKIAMLKKQVEETVKQT